MFTDEDLDRMAAEFAPAPSAPSAPRPEPRAPRRQGGGQYQAQLTEGIEAAARKYGLPPEAKDYLYAIADIESGFGRNMRGKAIGSEISGDMTHAGDRAMGPFQFMTKTAQAYGLKDRMDPYASADAAARHLIDSYKRQGDWHRAAIGHHSGSAWKSLGKWGKDYDQKLRQRLGTRPGGGGGGSAPSGYNAPSLDELAAQVADDYDFGPPQRTESDISVDDIDISDIEIPPMQQAGAAPVEAESGDFGAGFGQYWRTTKQMGAAGVAIAAEKMGLEGARDWGLKNYQELEAEGAQAAEGKVTQVEDIGGIGDAVDWLQYQFGQATGSVLETAGMALIGAVAGAPAGGPVGSIAGAGAGAVGKKGLKGLLRNKIAQEMKKQKAKGLSAEAARKKATRAVAAKAGALTAVFANSYRQGFGDIAGEFINEDGTIDENAFASSLLGAVPYAALDNILELSLVKNVSKGTKGETLLKRLAKGIGKGALKEGAAESGQEVVKMGAAGETINKFIEGLGAGKSYSSEEITSALMNSFLAGGVAGGAMAAPTAGMRTPEQVQTEQAAVAAQEAEAAALEAEGEATRERITSFSQSIDTIPETPQDEAAAIQAVQDGRKMAGMVVRPESIAAAEEAGLTTIEVDNGVLITTPENEQAVQQAEENGERYRVLGYAEDKEDALQDPDAVVVRPVQADGVSSPGAQVVSRANEEAARTLAEGQAGEGGTVETITMEEERDRRLQAEEELQAARAQEEGMWEREEARPQEEEMWAQREQEEVEEARKFAEKPPPATPAAIKRAKEMGIDLWDVPYDGPKIYPADVQRHAGKQPAKPATVTNIQEARQKKEHEGAVAEREATEAAPMSQKERAEGEQLVEAAVSVLDRATQKRKKRQVQKRDEGELITEAYEEVRAERKPKAKAGVGQDALDEQIAFLDKRMSWEQQDAKDKSVRGKPRRLPLPTRIDTVQSLAEPINKYRDEVLDLPVGKTEEGVTIARAGTDLRKRALKLTPNSAKSTVDRLETDIREWKREMDALTAERKTQTIAEAAESKKAEVKITWNYLAKNGLATEKQILNAIKKRQSPAELLDDLQEIAGVTQEQESTERRIPSQEGDVKVETADKATEKEAKAATAAGEKKVEAASPEAKKQALAERKAAQKQEAANLEAARSAGSAEELKAEGKIKVKKSRKVTKPAEAPAPTKYAESATALRTTLEEHGIKQPLYGDFQWTTKQGPFIRQTTVGDSTFELRIEAEGKGYKWSFERVEAASASTTAEEVVASINETLGPPVGVSQDDELAKLIAEQQEDAAEYDAALEDAAPELVNDTGQTPLKDMPHMLLLGKDEATLETLRKGFGGIALKGDVKSQKFPPNTAVVSPANSFGWMDGGIDAEYRDMFGPQIETRVQQQIKDRYGEGGMPIGEAFVIRTHQNKTPKGKPEWLIVTPTMTKPGRQTAQGAARPRATPDVAGKAAQAALEAAVENGIDNVAMPGMGMGTAAGVNNAQFADAFGLAYDQADDAKFGGEEVTRADRPSGPVPEESQSFAGTNLAEIIAKAEAWRRDVTAEAAEDGRKLMVLFHGTNKRAVNAVQDNPRASSAAINAATGKPYPLREGVYATPSPGDAATFAATNRYGAEHTGLVGWAWYADEFEQWQRLQKAAVGTMEYLGGKTINEYFFDPGLLDYQYDSRGWKRLAAAEETAVTPSNDILTQRDTAVETLAEGGGSDSLIRNLIDNLHADDPYAVLLETIQSKGIGDIPVTVMTQAEVAKRMNDGRARAGYIIKRNPDGTWQREIVLSRPLMKSRAGLKSFLHELVHASLNESMRTDNKLAQEMEELRQIAEDELGADTYYGLSDVDEFMAEAMSNPDFQRALASISLGEKTTLWQRFVTAVRKFLGTPVHDDSVLAHVLSAAPGLMMTEAQTLASLKSPRRRKSAYISDAMYSGQDIASSIMYSERQSADIMAPLLAKSREAKGTKLWARARQGKLGFMTTDQIVRAYESGMSAIRKWQTANQTRTSTARDMQQGSEKLNNRWRELERNNPTMGKKLAKLMHDSTIQGIDPRQGGSALAEEWAALSPEAKKIYTDVENFYQDQRQQLKTALLKRTLQFKVRHPMVRGIQTRLTAKLNTVPTPTTKEIDAAFQAEMAQASPELAKELDAARLAAREVIKLSGVRRPYFPLRRWGEYVISGESPSGEQYTEFFESENEARAEYEKRKTKGYRFAHGPSLKREVQGAGLTQNAPQLLSMLKEKFKGDEGVQGQLENAVIQLLAENNLRQADQKRRGVEGASLHMRRGFAERAFAGSWAIADAVTAFDRAEALTKMEQQAQGNPSLGQVVKEMRIRENKALSERTISPIDQFLSKFGFMWYLASPSYSVVNATQVPLVTIPYLTGKYGMKRTMQAYANDVGLVTAAAKEAFAWYRDNAKTMFSKTGEVQEPPPNTWELLSKDFDPDQRKMIDELQKKHLLGATFSQELFEAASNKEIALADKKGVAKAWGRTHVAARDALSFARAAPQAIESYNRVLTAKMAYDLAPGSHEQKVRAAEDAVYQTQFDYSDQNKPRHFKFAKGFRSVMMFKMYAQGIYSLLLTNAAKSFRGDTEAMKTLGYIGLSHSLAGGVLGGLFIEPVRALAGALAFAFGEDSEEWERDWKNMTANAFGKDIADMLNHGLPRGVGIDLSTRVGLDSIMLMDLRGQTFEDKLNNFVVQLGGPIVAVGANAAKGFDYAFGGQWEKAAQSWTPKFVRDALKTYEEQLGKGPTSRTGEDIQTDGEYTAWDGVIRGLGFAPARTSQAWERRIGGLAAKQKLESKTRTLRQKFVNATQAERIQMLRGEILEHNQSVGNPRFILRPDKLWESVRDRAKREREQIGGYFVDTKERKWLSETVQY